jgi:hypothetical protein
MGEGEAELGLGTTIKKLITKTILPSTLSFSALFVAYGIIK